MKENILYFYFDHLLLKSTLASLLLKYLEGIAKLGTVDQHFPNKTLSLLTMNEIITQKVYHFKNMYLRSEYITK